MTTIRKTPDGYEVSAGGTRISLPSSTELRDAAMVVAGEYGGRDSIAVRLLDDCDFEFEVVPGGDAFEDVIGVVIVASPNTAALLQDPLQEVAAELLGAVQEVCPDICAHRVTVRPAS